MLKFLNQRLAGFLILLGDVVTWAKLRLGIKPKPKPEPVRHQPAIRPLSSWPPLSPTELAHADALYGELGSQFWHAACQVEYSDTSQCWYASCNHTDGRLRWLCGDLTGRKERLPCWVLARDRTTEFSTRQSVDLALRMACIPGGFMHPDGAVMYARAFDTIRDTITRPEGTPVISNGRTGRQYSYRDIEQLKKYQSWYLTAAAKFTSKRTERPAEFWDGLIAYCKR